MKKFGFLLLACSLALGMMIPASAVHLRDIDRHWAESEINEAIGDG